MSFSLELTEDSDILILNHDLGGQFVWNIEIQLLNYISQPRRQTHKYIFKFDLKLLLVA
jgi:hypothetical protein